MSSLIDFVTQRKQEQDLKGQPNECEYCRHLGYDVAYHGGWWICENLDECLYRMDKQLGNDNNWHYVLLSPSQRRRLDVELKP